MQAEVEKVTGNKWQVTRGRQSARRLLGVQCKVVPPPESFLFILSLSLSPCPFLTKEKEKEKE
ncbi:hypothetical protein [Termitidicoccus mucosus]|uniref:hypothetical protein n=1 Tax=Termitidicoccus mucosus TaxID=1184151 RepID=UPI003183F931